MNLRTFDKFFFFFEHWAYWHALHMCTAPRNEACQMIEALLASFQLQRPEREPEAAAHSVAENNANDDPEAQPPMRKKRAL